MPFSAGAGTRNISIRGIFLFFLSAYLVLQTVLQVKLAWWNETNNTNNTHNHLHLISTTKTDSSAASNQSTAYSRKSAKNIFSKETSKKDDADNDDEENDVSTSSSKDDISSDFFGEDVSLLQDDDPFLPKLLAGLPRWMIEYLTWHRQIRTEFPGKLLMEHPDAPPVLIRTCFGICGGLNDRLGQIPWDLYLANATGRVLLLHWHRPAPLEHFLVPNHVFDWRVPVDAFPGYFPPDHTSMRCVPPPVMRKAKFLHKGLFDGMDADKPEEAFFSNDVPRAIERATIGEYKNEKVLRHRLLGHLHEHALEERLLAAGETDMIHNTTTYGRLFEIFFRPSARLQQKLDVILAPLSSPLSTDSEVSTESLNEHLLQPYHYTAVHCRVRHPKVAKKWRPTSARGDSTNADKTGLLWKGDDRAWAIRITNHALQCAATVAQPSITTKQQQHEPIYLLADSGDLVNYFVHELSNVTYRAQHKAAFTQNPVEAKALELSQSMSLVSRPLESETVHLDLQKGRPAPAYDDTFVDFYLLLRARCLVFGVGNFAWLAAKINKQAAQCNLLHQAEAWGEVARKMQRTPQCSIEDEMKQ